MKEFRIPGKTTLLLNPIINFYGLSGVSTVDFNSKFGFSGIKEDQILVLDEFTYHERFRSDLLKLFNGELLSIDIKYSSIKQLRFESQILLLCNKRYENETFFLDDAFRNRLNFFAFNSILEPKLYPLIDKELFLIIIFLNKINKF